MAGIEDSSRSAHPLVSARHVRPVADVDSTPPASCQIIRGPEVRSRARRRGQFPDDTQERRAGTPMTAAHYSIALYGAAHMLIGKTLAGGLSARKGSWKMPPHRHTCIMYRCVRHHHAPQARPCFYHGSSAAASARGCKSGSL